jgi:CMP-N,N'-diacetyllegionaminic acid synthase
LEEVLVIVPARAGSKGVPGKNKKILGGIPLIGYTLFAALEVFDVSQICISTDDSEIIEYAESLGLKVPFIRPAHLCGDDAGTYEVLMHAIDYYSNKGLLFKRIVLLQPTSPFRKGKHIREAFHLFRPDLDMVVSVKKTKANPYFVLFEEDENGFLQKSKKGDFVRRQDVPEVWEYNGAIYVINAESLKKHKINEFAKVEKYVMDEISSFDIDTQVDWLLAETIIEKDILPA